MKNKKIVFLFFFLLCFSFVSQANSVNYPILFQMLGVDNSGRGWKDGIWLYTDGVGQANASCPQGAEMCHLYIQMQQNNNIIVSITSSLAYNIYCELSISNANGSFAVKILPIKNSLLNCSLNGDANAGNLVLYINKLD